MSFSKILAAASIATAMVVLSGVAFANVSGHPLPWQMGMQTPVSPVMAWIHDFTSLLHWIATAIAVFVTVLMAYVIVRFSAKRNPVPSKTTHNTLLEVAWTVIPIMILVVIAIPSFKLLYFEDRAPDAEMTVKAVGHQWYWSYVYPDHGDFSFDALIKGDEELAPGEPRLLATDTQVVVPVNTKVRVLTTSDDVIHAWAVPSLGVKTDAVPGRINETWFLADREGVFYGQCSELCGVNHGYMPIAVKVVSKEEFAAWVEKAKVAYLPANGQPRKLAAR